MGEINDIPNIPPPEGLIQPESLPNATPAELVAILLYNAEVGLGGPDVGEGFSRTLQGIFAKACATFEVDQMTVVSVLEAWAGNPPQKATPATPETLIFIPGSPEAQLTTDPQLMKQLLVQTANRESELGLTPGYLGNFVNSMLDQPGITIEQITEFLTSFTI